MMMTPGCSQTNELGVHWLLRNYLPVMKLHHCTGSLSDWSGLQLAMHKSLTDVQQKKRSCKNSQRHKLLCAPAAAIKTTRIFVVNQASRGGQLGSSAIISMCHVMRQCFLCWAFLEERPNFQHFRVVYVICSAKDSQKNTLSSTKWQSKMIA